MLVSLKDFFAIFKSIYWAAVSQKKVRLHYTVKLFQ